MGFRVEVSKRIKELPPYLFADIDRKVAEARAKGVDIIDLGIGDPDSATPKHIIEALKTSVDNKINHRYPSYSGMIEYREAVAGWYKRRFNVTLDPASEVLSLIGSKEGIGHIPFALVDKGDYVLVPTPGYPVYATATMFAGGDVFFMPLLKQNSYLPDLASIPEHVAKKAKMMFLNYPNNPTAAVTDSYFFKEVINFAVRYNVIICHDNAYSEVYFNGKKPMSFLEVPGAKEVGVEFHSLSKTYNMTGWRLGFVAGNKEVVSALGKIKSNLDSGVFRSVQEAGIAALNTDDAFLDDMRSMYQKRRDVVVTGLRKIGIDCELPTATFYVWASVPKGKSSAEFVGTLLEKCGVVTTPGNGFGAPGEGYFRISLTLGEEQLKEAMDRIKSLS